MKKKLSLLLVLAMTGSILLTGCGTDKKYASVIACLDEGNYAGAISLIQNMERESLLAESGGDEEINTILTLDEFAALFSEQAITPENLDNYIEIVESEKEYTDNFGDKTGALSRFMTVSFKENVGMMTGMELIMEFSYDSVERNRTCREDGTVVSEGDPRENSDTTQITLMLNNRPLIKEIYYRTEPDGISYVSDNESGKGYYETICELSNLTCIRTKGSIILAEIPEDKWNTNNEGRFLAIIGENGDLFKYYENGRITSDSFVSEIPENEETDIFYNLSFFLDGRVLSNG